MSHKFPVGALVRLRLQDRGFAHETASRNTIYEITRLMPPDHAGEYGYRLKSDVGERVARESEIMDN